MSENPLRRGTVQRCTAGVVMLLLTGGMVGLAMASDDEPAAARASSIDSLPTGPTARPSASPSPSTPEGRTGRDADPAPDGGPTPAPRAESSRSSAPESPRPAPTTTAPATRTPAPTAPATQDPSPSPTTPDQPRERGAIGDLLAGLLGQD